eukprot:m.111090 g.111090  ORF g.111090 m.111090 type:complete len:50 (+) comp15940_c0_seq3:313-462(+)
MAVDSAQSDAAAARVPVSTTSSSASATPACSPEAFDGDAVGGQQQHVTA